VHVYTPRRRRSSSRGLRILALIMALALIGATVVLFRGLGGDGSAGTATPDPGEAGAGAGAATIADGASAGAGASAPSAPLAPSGGATAGAAGAAGPSAGSGSAYPAGSAGNSVPPTEGFLRVGRPGVDYTGAYVVERRTGRVLYEYNAHVPVPTASMAKMMTALLVMEEIDAGRLRLDDTVTTSARAAGMGGSQIYARHRQVFTIETLLTATMVQSANDASTSLAEKVAGSNEAFAELMNRRARTLGLEGSTFYDPHGLPSRDGRENAMTPRDLAVVGNEVMRYPLMREYAAAATWPFENATFTSGMTNPNFLLRGYDGAYGIKTGYTVSAGFSVTAAARRGDTDILAVVTGAKSSRGRESSFELAGRMMDEAFLNWSSVVAVREGAAAGDVPVKGGMASTVPAVAAHDVTALVARGDEGTVRWTLEPAALQAPVAAGDTVGTITVLLSDGGVERVPALAAATVEVRPWWRFWGGG